MTTRKLSRGIVGVVAASAVILALGGCTAAASGSADAGSSTDPADLDLSGVTLNFGLTANSTEAGFLASGVLDDAPYTVEFPSFQNTGDIGSALATGAIDITWGFTQWTAAQTAANATKPWSEGDTGYSIVGLVETGDAENYDPYMVLSAADSGIDDIADAKGKRWGYVPGSVLQLITAAGVDQQGWSLDTDITPVTLDFTSLALALPNDQADLETVYINSAGAALASGAKKIATASTLGIDLAVAYTASNAALEDPAKSAAIGDLLERLTAYYAWFASHPDEATESFETGLHLDAAAAEQSWEYNRGILRPVTSEAIATTQDMVDRAQGFGLLTTGIDANLLFDDRFTEQIESGSNDADQEAVVRGSF